MTQALDDSIAPRRLVDIDKLVQAEQHLAEIGHGQFAGIFFARGGVRFGCAAYELERLGQLFIIGRTTQRCRNSRAGRPAPA